MMNIVGKVYYFFEAHLKRQRKFEDMISETQPSFTFNKLKNLCRTRHVQRHSPLSISR
uniref:Uncharacterized protein n=1 Tax=Amphimedon queenslandica TaxID=400682 RepID=A0A1X7VGU8_AMPQE